MEHEDALSKKLSTAKNITMVIYVRWLKHLEFPGVPMAGSLFQLVSPPEI